MKVTFCTVSLAKYFYALPISSKKNLISPVLQTIELLVILFFIVIFHVVYVIFHVKTSYFILRKCCIHNYLFLKF